MKSYLSFLKREWEDKKHLLTELISIYLGGGTPSLLEPNELESILSFIGQTAQEITLEANPENVTLEKMKAYKALGINRVSIGVQSLSDSSLQVIERGHSSQKAIDAIELTFQAGIENISIDLMYDLPHQSLHSWRKTIDIAATLPIMHLSLYNLIMEEGSLYFKRQKELKKTIPSDETSLAMLSYAVESLEKAGLKRYEISAFARNNHISLHNTGYWTARPFIGIGPAAFSYYEGRRFRNIPHLKKWQAAIENGIKPIDFTETLPYPDNVHELLAVRLRLLEGVDLSLFSLPLSTETVLKNLEEEGFLIKEKNKVRLSEKGTLFYDTVAAHII